ncbi:MAG: hypothetical protein IJR28_05355 [Ottowia sp.]|nr:hypothetical protein [Ottowia sp.]
MKLRVLCAAFAAVTVLAACSQETPQAPQTSLTPEELDAKAQRAAGEQREIPIPEFARKARFYDLKKDHFRQLNFVFEPAQGSALAFYRDFFTAQGWLACQQPGGETSSLVLYGGKQVRQRVAVFVKEAESKQALVVEHVPDTVPALMPEDAADEIEASVGVYDFPSPKVLAQELSMTKMCPAWQQK